MARPLRLMRGFAFASGCALVAIIGRRFVRWIASGGVWENVAFAPAVDGQGGADDGAVRQARNSTAIRWLNLWDSAYRVWGIACVHRGYSPNVHHHPETECYIFLWGTGKLVLGENTHIARAPCALIIPAGMPHAMTPVSERVFLLFGFPWLHGRGPFRRIHYTRFAAVLLTTAACDCVLTSARLGLRCADAGSEAVAPGRRLSLWRAIAIASGLDRSRSPSADGVGRASLTPSKGSCESDRRRILRHVAVSSPRDASAWVTSSGTSDT